MNAIRIALTGIINSKWGPTAAEGFFHAFEGWLFFMIAFVFLFGIGKILDLFPESQKNEEPDRSKKETEEKRSLIEFFIQHKRVVRASKNMLAFLVSIFLLICVGVLTWTTSNLPPVLLKGGIESFPLKIGNWQGRRQYIDQEIVTASGAEESFGANYYNTKGEMVGLYLGYRSTPFLENENFFHTPIACFPSSGWKILKKNTYTFLNTIGISEMKASSIVAKRLTDKLLVFFWFQTNKKATHIKSLNRLHLALHAIKKDNTHDLFIRLTTPIKSNNVQDAEKRLDDFAFAFSQMLDQFLTRKQYIGGF